MTIINMNAESFRFESLFTDRGILQTIEQQSSDFRSKLRALEDSIPLHHADELDITPQDVNAVRMACLELLEEAVQDSVVGAAVKEVFDALYVLTSDYWFDEEEFESSMGAYEGNSISPLFDEYAALIAAPEKIAKLSAKRQGILERFGSLNPLFESVSAGIIDYSLYVAMLDVTTAGNGEFVMERATEMINAVYDENDVPTKTRDEHRAEDICLILIEFHTRLRDHLEQEGHDVHERSARMESFKAFVQEYRGKFRE